MLRTLMLSSAVVVLVAAPALAKDLRPGCNAAVQNWQNGSQDTCPYGSGTIGNLPGSVPPSAPDYPYEEPVVEVEVE
jgi:hypothetical protein